MSQITARNLPIRKSTGSRTLAAVWSLMLMVSLLPDIVLNEILDLDVAWLGWGKVLLLLIVFGLSLVWETIKPVRALSIILLALLLLQYGHAWAVDSAVWREWFAGSQATFAEEMLGNQLLRVAGAFLMIGVLLLIGYRPARAYLQWGDLGAPVRPIRFLGIKEGEITWAKFGWLSALALGAGTLVFLVMGGTLPANFLAPVLGFLPVVLLLATMNAFAEEVLYRSALLAPIRAILPRAGAIWLTALYFGLAHFYGIPYGFVGVIMATVLGWLLGKSMVETGGFFWPWFIHFVQDVLIFVFMAAGSIAPGG